MHSNIRCGRLKCKKIIHSFTFSRNNHGFLLLCFQRTSEHTIYSVFFKKILPLFFKIDRFFLIVVILFFNSLCSLLLIMYTKKSQRNFVESQMWKKNMITKSAKNQINVHTIGPWKLDVKIGFYCSNLSRKRLSTKSEQHSCFFCWKFNISPIIHCSCCFTTFVA